MFFYFRLDLSLFNKIISFIFGHKALENDLYFPQTLKKFSFKQVYSLIALKNLDYVLFNLSNNGEFFYDDYSEFLNVQNFKHSTLLEFVWASFPTIIIILILIPSLFLLYSLDEDFYPEFTLKVIGHQWFWTYEYSD